MLMLSRKCGQSLVIASDIVVRVVDIGRGRVQLGISAPPSCTIHREEIFYRIQDEAREAELELVPASGTPTSKR